MKEKDPVPVQSSFSLSLHICMQTLPDFSL